MISEPPALKRTSEVSKRAYALLLLLTAACFSAALIYSNTEDVALLSNTGSLPLPGTSIKVPVATFFIVMPCIAAALWIHLQLVFLQLWQDFADCPAIFPDGEPRHRKGDNWLFGSYIWIFSERSSIERAGWLRLTVFVLLNWFVVPVTLIVSWVLYLRRHDLTGSIIQCAAIVSLITFGMRLGWASISVFVADLTSVPPKRYLFGIGIAVAGMLFLLSNAAANGVPYFDDPEFLGYHDVWYRRLGQHLLAFAHLRTQVILRDKTLTEEQKGLEGVDFKYSDAYHLVAASASLRKATLTGAFLVDADLSDAHLESANLVYSDLTDAHLEGAFLDDSHLELSDAGSGHFTGAHMRNARLTEAYLRGADFSGANLFDSDFRGADLREAKFLGADLLSTNFYMADLRGADFTGAKNTNAIQCLALANLDGTIGLSGRGSIGGSDDEEYRRELIDALRHGTQECAVSGVALLDITGPPDIRLTYIEPRSLRHESVEWPTELPRSQRDEISAFLDYVKTLHRSEVNEAFLGARQKLAFEVPWQFPGAFVAYGRRPTSSNDLLEAFGITCHGIGNGVELSLSVDSSH